MADRSPVGVLRSGSLRASLPKWQAAISRWETGERTPSARSLVALAAALQCSGDERMQINKEVPAMKMYICIAACGQTEIEFEFEHCAGSAVNMADAEMEGNRRGKG